MKRVGPGPLQVSMSGGRSSAGLIGANAFFTGLVYLREA